MITVAVAAGTTEDVGKKNFSRRVCCYPFVGPGWPQSLFDQKIQMGMNPLINFWIKRGPHGWFLFNSFKLFPFEVIIAKSYNL